MELHVSSSIGPACAWALASLTTRAQRLVAVLPDPAERNALALVLRSHGCKQFREPLGFLPGRPACGCERGGRPSPGIHRASSCRSARPRPGRRSRWRRGDDSHLEPWPASSTFARRSRTPRPRPKPRRPRLGRTRAFRWKALRRAHLAIHLTSRRVDGPSSRATERRCRVRPRALKARRNSRDGTRITVRTERRFARGSWQAWRYGESHPPRCRRLCSSPDSRRCERASSRFAPRDRSSAEMASAG